MPAKRAKGERLLEDALAALARALDEAGAPWMIIGGIAVIAHGVRRFTTDIDAAVQGDAVLREPWARRHEADEDGPGSAARARQTARFGSSIGPRVDRRHLDAPPPERLAVADLPGLT